MKFKVFLTGVVLVMGLGAVGCSSNENKMSIGEELIAPESPIVGSSRGAIEEYWKKSDNHDLAKKSIVIEHSFKFNNSYQDDATIYYSMGHSPLHGLGDFCTDIGISVSKLDGLKDKKIKDVVDIAKSLINTETNFYVDQEDLYVIKDGSNNKIVYYLILKSDEVVDDNYVGNVNGDKKPFEEIQIIKDREGLYLTVGNSYIVGKRYLRSDYTQLNTELINDESTLNEILKVNKEEDIKQEYIRK